VSEARTVLIVEDEPATRARLRGIVEGMEELRVLDAVGSCQSAREAMDRELPALLLTDLGLPDGSGIELIGELRARAPEVESVVITVFGDADNVIRSVERGASGYLLKGGTQEEVERSLRELLAGGSPISPAIARHVLARLRDPGPAPLASSTSPPAAGLSDREREVLELAAKGFTFGEIGDLLGITTHTVTTHMRRVYGKLEVRSRAEAVYEAAQLGLVSLDGD
jgi:DNA-binding NarL/FixJ family response regulator